jgi:hypothetical protein
MHDWLERGVKMTLQIIEISYIQRIARTDIWNSTMSLHTHTHTHTYTHTHTHTHKHTQGP